MPEIVQRKGESDDMLQTLHEEMPRHQRLNKLETKRNTTHLKLMKEQSKLLNWLD
jgi:hypothetical protein